MAVFLGKTMFVVRCISGEGDITVLLKRFSEAKKMYERNKEYLPELFQVHNVFKLAGHNRNESMRGVEPIKFKAVDLLKSIKIPIDKEESKEFKEALKKKLRELK